MKGQELVWAMLPEGLEEYFEVEGYEKRNEYFRITLIEKNTIPAELPKKYQGRKVINTVLNKVFVEDFPIRGRKGELLFKRRSWKFEGVDEWLTRPFNIRAKGTKLEQEFADFLKEFNRK